MPWRDASPMDQRTQFIADHLRDALPFSELCELYGVSRKTGYKWIDRYVRHGPAGLEERSRRPRRSPRQTSDEIVTAIKKRGGVVEYVLFDNEGHGFTKKANEIRAYKAILDFLDKHLKGAEVAREKAG